MTRRRPSCALNDLPAAPLRSATVHLISDQIRPGRMVPYVIGALRDFKRKDADGIGLTFDRHLAEWDNRHATTQFIMRCAVDEY